ncbi:MAG TPA: class I SAM-dependent methyltransferase [Victivallales bacterium]|nr:class I SAM-dependent methyltransferase [Victivallales bacterium]
MDKQEPEKCLICKKKNVLLRFTVSDFDTQTHFYDIFQCKDCNFAFVFPYPEKNIIRSYYNKNYYGSVNRKFTPVVEYITRFYNSLRAANINKIISKSASRNKFINSNKILDIGCGRGNLLKQLGKYKYECYGLERSEFNFELSSKIKIYQKELTESNFNNMFFRCIILWHVYEHLDDSPDKILAEITRIHIGKGVLIISVPNFTSFQSYIFGKYWFHLDLPRHKYHFSIKSIELLLAKYNYKVIRKTTFSFEQSIFGFIQSFYNKLMPSKTSNQFYSLLRLRGKNCQQYFQLIFFLLISILILPFAIIEYIFSGLFGKGAVITIYSVKNT